MVKYEKPIMEVLTLASTDVIRTSTELSNPSYDPNKSSSDWSEWQY